MWEQLTIVIFSFEIKMLWKQPQVDLHKLLFYNRFLTHFNDWALLPKQKNKQIFINGLHTESSCTIVMTIYLFTLSNNICFYSNHFIRKCIFCWFFRKIQLFVLLLNNTCVFHQSCKIILNAEFSNTYENGIQRSINQHRFSFSFLNYKSF